VEPGYIGQPYGADGRPLPVLEQAAEEEADVGRALAEPAHDVGKPGGSERHVNPDAVALGGQRQLEVVPDAEQQLEGKPFLNTAGAVIDCNKSKVTFHINGTEHTIHFPKKQFQVNGINIIEKSPTITIGSFQFPIPTVKKKYDTLIVGNVHIPIEVT
jgi:hypothetical protein